MKKILLLSLSASILFTIGCSGTDSMVSESQQYSNYQGKWNHGNTPVRASLFTSDSKIMTDEEIKRILDFDFKPQKLNRIAIMPMGPRQFGWSDKLDKKGLAVQNTLTEKLRKSKKVYDASYLPTLLVPDKKSIGYLREAAARYQADLMLIYTTSFRTYEKHKVFSPDKTKAYCSLEAILLDTRTGIVPFTILVTKTFTAEKQRSEINFYETVRKAELLALESALSEVGDELVKFLAETKN